MWLHVFIIRKLYSFSGIHFNVPQILPFVQIPTVVILSAWVPRNNKAWFEMNVNKWHWMLSSLVANVVTTEKEFMADLLSFTKFTAAAELISSTNIHISCDIIVSSWRRIAAFVISAAAVSHPSFHIRPSFHSSDNLFPVLSQFIYNYTMYIRVLAELIVCFAPICRTTRWPLDTITNGELDHEKQLQRFHRQEKNRRRSEAFLISPDRRGRRIYICF